MTDAANSSRSRYRHLFSTLVVTFGIQGVGLITGITVARLLGVEGRGELAAVILWGSAITYVGDLGLPVAYVYEAARDRRQIPALVGNAFLATVLQWLILVVVGIPILLLALQSHSTEIVQAGVIFLVGFIPLNLLVRYLNALNQGLGLFSRFNAVRISVHVAYAAVLLALVVFGMQSVMWVAIATLIGNVATLFLILSFSLPRFVREFGAPRVDAGLLWRSATYGAKAHIGNLTPVDALHIDLLLVTALLAPAQAGLYAIAISAGAVVRSLGVAFGMVALPEVASAANEHQQRQSIGELFRLGLLVSIVGAAALGLAGDLLVPLVYGGEYAPAVTSLRILLIGIVAAGARQVLADCLRGAGRPGAGTVAEIASWVIAIPGLVVLVPTFGVQGAAMAVSLSYVGALLVVLIFTVRHGVGLDDLFVPRMSDLRPLGRLLAPAANAFYAAAAVVRAAVVAAGAALAFAVIGILISVIEPSERAALIAGIGLVAGLPLVVRMLQGRLDLFEPLTAACGALLIMFVGRPVALIIADESPHLIGVPYPGANFNEALTVALVGCCAFVVGYFLPLGERVGSKLPRPSVAFHADTAITYALAIFAVGAALYGIFLMQSGGLSTLGSMLAGQQQGDDVLYRSSSGYFYDALNMAIPASLLLMASGLITRRGGLVALALAIMIPVTVLGGASGGRLDLLVLVGSSILFAYLYLDKRPGFLTCAIGAVLILTIGIGFLRDSRTVETREESRLEMMWSSLTDPVSEFEELFLGPDTEMFDTLALELTEVPEDLEYQRGAVFTDILTRAVPRPLWPDKPLESNDAMVDHLFPAHFEQSRAAPASSIVGSLYLDSGLVTVVGGMFAVGVGLRACWSWLMRWRELVAARLVYAALLPLIIILLRGGLPHTLAIATFTVIPLIVGLKLAARQPDRAPSLSRADQGRQGYAEALR